MNNKNDSDNNDSSINERKKALDLDNLNALYKLLNSFNGIS